jgi:hypothetical protein
MPATPTPLVFAADVSKSKNPYLKTIAQATTCYNLLLKLTVNQKQKNSAYLLDGKMVGSLDAIVKSGMGYILSRPHCSRSDRGQDRIEKIGQLISQIFDHAEYFGIKFLHGDLGKTAKWNYWVERATQHWIEDPKKMKAKLVAWINLTEKSVAKPFSDELTDSDNTLEYFTEADRAKYEVQFKGRSIVHNSGNVLNTKRGTGSFSSLNGSYIYVCSARTRKIYTAPSEQGKLHHSSFLSGEPVLAAGDWVVENGILKLINGESGHYRPAGANIEFFLRVFNGSLRPNAWVKPTHDGPVYKICDYLRDGPVILDKNGQPKGGAKVDQQGMAFVDANTN